MKIFAGPAHFDIGLDLILYGLGKLRIVHVLLNDESGLPLDNGVVELLRPCFIYAHPIPAIAIVRLTDPIARGIGSEFCIQKVRFLWDGKAFWKPRKVPEHSLLIRLKNHSYL